VKGSGQRHHFVSPLRWAAYAQAGVAFGDRLLAQPGTEYVRVFEVMRDYSMYDRAEAPQYYPPVERVAD